MVLKNIVFYVPPPSTKWFLEIAVLQQGGLQECLANSGVTSRIETESLTNFHPTDLYIIYHGGCEHLAFPWNGCVPYILANYEQSTAAHFDFPLIVGRARKAQAVWEYSMRNVIAWRERHQIEAKFVPLGFHKNLTPLVCQPARPMPPHYKLDALFYGASHPRRSALLDKLKRAGLMVVEVHDMFDKVLWGLVAHAKIIVNIHFYMPSILELARIIPALIAGKLVISEKSDDHTLDAMYNSLVVFANDEEEFIQLCLDYSKNDAKRNERISFAQNSLHQRFQQQVVFRQWKDLIV